MQGITEPANSSDSTKGLFESLTITPVSILTVVLTLFLVWLLLKVVRKFIKKPIGGKEVDLGRRNSLFQIIKYFVWFFAIVFALEVIGVKTSGLILSSTALLVGLGLGIQNTFNDVVSGIIILFDGTLEIGDIVTVDGMVGKVVKITLRNTKIIDRDDIYVIVPNRKFVNENVINWSHMDAITRFSVKVGVHYKEDENLVRAALLQAMSDTRLIVDYKGYTPFVRFVDFGQSTLDFEMIFWSKEMFRIENVKSELRFNVRKRFRENNIEIAFPQLDIHFRSDERKQLNDESQDKIES